MPKNEATEIIEEPKSAVIARRGVVTADDCIDLCLALAADVVNESVKPATVNASVTAVGKALRLFEAKMKYRKANSAGPLVLSSGE